MAFLQFETNILLWGLPVRMIWSPTFRFGHVTCFGQRMCKQRFWWHFLLQQNRLNQYRIRAFQTVDIGSARGLQWGHPCHTGRISRVSKPESTWMKRRVICKRNGSIIAVGNKFFFWLSSNLCDFDRSMVKYDHI
jgi:hypothetical protein